MLSKGEKLVQKVLQMASKYQGTDFQRGGQSVKTGYIRHSGPSEGILYDPSSSGKIFALHGKILQIYLPKIIDKIIAGVEYSGDLEEESYEQPGLVRGLNPQFVVGYCEQTRNKKIDAGLIINLKTQKVVEVQELDRELSQYKIKEAPNLDSFLRDLGKFKDYEAEQAIAEFMDEFYIARGITKLG